MSKNAASTKWLQIGAALRVERERQRHSLSDFATKAGVSKGHLSKIENGKVPLKEHQLAKMLTLLEVTGERYDEIIGLLQNADAAEWTATEVGDRDAMNSALADFEARASSIVDNALAIVPGLIQHPEYTRAIMSSGFVPPSEISARVAMRMGRSSVIDPNRTDEPAQYTAYLDEAVLRKRVGGTTVMVKQLRFLQKVAAWPNTTIRVIPDSIGWYPGMTGAFSKINPRDPDNLTVVYLETRRSGQILHLDEDMEEYDRVIVAAQRAAMSPDETTKLIAAAIEGMEQLHEVT
jgi:transcriptional regulator with XRE-family HTH domain